MLQLKVQTFISPAAAHEPALMQYVLDGPTWSFISPFLDLRDTFNMRTTATSWNFAAKLPGRCTPNFLVAQCTWAKCWQTCAGGTVQFGGYRNVLRRHQNNVTN